MTNETQKSPSALKARRHIKALVGTSTFFHSYVVIDEDEGYSERRRCFDRIEGDRHVWDILARDLDDEYRPQAIADILKIETVEKLCDAINIALSDGDWSCGPSVVETLEQFEARRLAERRRKLEAAASEIAIRYKCEVSSLEFIAACYLELERFKDYRVGLREDGLCIGYGVTYEQWSDEFNASQGDTNDVHDILDWLRTACPLLWASYTEQRMREQSQEKETECCSQSLV